MTKHFDFAFFLIIARFSIFLPLLARISSEAESNLDSLTLLAILPTLIWLATNSLWFIDGFRPF
ncbi:hypothetical protein F5878DRAFT_633807 [Lentinula raphanica]|uniref:Uncharacterized protein n=1 Tax=Lentinula raphanica TaxID=153919 RepID=A0AA38NYQ7_9AGAR|nr:hypothetical protein F5878DRAFT_633807 [Lentinula raphanica]